MSTPFVKKTAFFFLASGSPVKQPSAITGYCAANPGRAPVLPAVQARENDIEIIELASKIDHKPTRIATDAERLVLAAMKGGCSIPLGVYAKITEKTLEIHAMIADLDGKNLIKLTKSSPVEQYQTCAAELAAELLQSGGQEILDRLKKES